MTDQTNPLDDMQKVLEEMETKLAKVRAYEEQLEAQVAAQRGAIEALTMVKDSPELQRQLLPHLFDEKQNGMEKPVKK